MSATCRGDGQLSSGPAEYTARRRFIDGLPMEHPHRTALFLQDMRVYTFHQRRTDPSLYGVNIGCFDDVDGTAFHDATTADRVLLSLVSQ